MKSKNKIKMIIIDFVICAVLIWLDQITKIWATGLKLGNPIIIIQNVIQFRYLENFGAAFGILQNSRMFFLAISVVVFAFIAYVYIKIPDDKKYVKFHICLAFILAGAIGNTIDRIYLGYVRDFIYFNLIDFPIFNVADCYITCCMIWLVIMILFCYKEEDFEFLSRKKSDK